MTDINDRINDLVGTFVVEITRLARSAAVDTLSRALGGNPVRAVPGARRRGRPQTPRKAARSSGAKRPREEIIGIQERVLAHITENPGQRIEQINKVLGTQTTDLSLPLRKLVAAGAITRKGERRATTYFPGSGGKRRRVG